MKYLALATLLVALQPGTVTAQGKHDQPPIVRVVREPPPIVRTNVVAQSRQQFGYWVATDSGDYTEALTTNESGSTFGMLCGTSCIIYLDFQTGCQNGDLYPAMVNSPTGAFSTELTCHHLDDRYILSTDAVDSYVTMISEGGEVGFAIPLKSGRFSVSRFSLTGGLKAVETVVAGAVAKREASQEGIRDFTI